MDALREKHDRIQTAVRYIRTGHAYDALKILRQLQTAYPKDALVYSYLGLTMVLTAADVTEGLRMCEKAATAGVQQPSLVANFVTACLETGDRERAVSALREGLGYHTDNKELNRLAWKMGVRRKPLFPFLGRSNFLNVWSGKLTWWLGGGRNKLPASTM